MTQNIFRRLLSKVTFHFQVTWAAVMQPAWRAALPLSARSKLHLCLSSAQSRVWALSSITLYLYSVIILLPHSLLATKLEESNTLGTARWRRELSSSLPPLSVLSSWPRALMGTCYSHSVILQPGNFSWMHVVGWLKANLHWERKYNGTYVTHWFQVVSIVVTVRKQRSCFAVLSMQNNYINCVASLGKY